MKLRIFKILWLVPVLILINCTRSGVSADDELHVINNNDTIFPVISLNKPLSNQEFITGETITIEGKVTDQGLYRGNIQIVNASNNSIIKEQSYEIHGLPEYNFSISHKTSVSSTTDYTITVWFEDHGLNVTTKIVKVKVNP